MQRLFKQSGHFFWKIRGTGPTSYIGTCKDCFEQPGHCFWEIRGTGLTAYVRTCKGCFEQSGHLLWEIRGIGLTCYAKIVSAIRKSLQKNQRPRTHKLYWNIQRLFEQLGHPFREIRGIKLTAYVRTCKVCFKYQGIPPEKSEVWHSHSMLKHTNVVWPIRGFLQKHKRHWTHKLCWKMQRLFEQSELLLRNQRHWTHILC